MTKEKEEYERLVSICGTALLQRVIYLNQEVTRQQREEMEAKKKPEETK